MTATANRIGFLSLPVELRLQILEHFIDEAPNAGFIQHTGPFPGRRPFNQVFQGLVLDPRYSSVVILNILLVCRQLRTEFTNVAFRRTVFVIWERYYVTSRILQPLRRHQLENLRNVVLVSNDYRLGQIISWRWPFNTEALHLVRLTIALQPIAQDHYPVAPDDYPALFTYETVGLLRRLEHVKNLSFVQNATFIGKDFRMLYNRLIGLLLKEDHYQRYDAPGAPHVEATWWNWDFNSVEKSFEFIARPAKTVVSEADYMQLVSPLVAKWMSEMETAS